MWDDARSHVVKAFAEFSAIEGDKNLSAAGREQKKKEIGAAALAAFSKSKSLEKARASVEHQVKKWDEQLGVAPKPPETPGDAMIHAEIRRHLAAMKPPERLAFIDAHATEVAQAVLTAPSFLAGLTPAERGVVQRRIAERTNPTIAGARSATTKALAEAEQGWRNAANQIRERAGIEKIGDGVAK